MNGHFSSTLPRTWEDRFDQALADFPLAQRQAYAQWKRMTPKERQFAQQWLQKRIASLPETQRRMVHDLVKRALREGWRPGQLSGNEGLGNAAAWVSGLAALATTGFQIYTGLEEQKAQKRAQKAQLQLAREAAAREAAMFEQMMRERRAEQQRQEQLFAQQQAALQAQLRQQAQAGQQAAASAGIPPRQVQSGGGTGTKTALTAAALAAAAAGGALLLAKG